MRYIPLSENSPDTEWINKAEKVLDELRAAPDQETREKIIDRNKKLWSNLKEWLLNLSYQKCWYSEARDCFSHWDVEHFRPKTFAQDSNGTKHEGYWWLAFDWKNYRVCGNVGNRKKGMYFPLRDGCERVCLDGDLRMEEPMLLDPADPDDPCLISFNAVGNAIIDSAVDDIWEQSRVNYSIERYRLNSYQPLVDKRKLVWNECGRLVNEYLNNLNMYKTNDSSVARESVRNCAKSIRSMLLPEKEFSTVARACLESFGDKRLSGLLRSN
jgi:hypothetical protein